MASKTKQKTGAEGYLLAKRQIVEAIDKRLADINSEVEVLSTEEIAMNDILEELRHYVRNVMLWKEENESKD